MKPTLHFDFLVDKENKTVTVIKEFDATLDLVWQAWTDKDLLDQWWAPRPWKSRTKYMDFIVGGKRFYAMVGPEGQEHWSLQEYTAISPKTNFKMLNAFADKDENPNLPGSEWDVDFNEQAETTSVHVTIYNPSRERMEMMLEMGFKEGFTATLHYLEEVLRRSF
jgi:uncharacterized protein YndB with AHSA1/START domain